MIKMGKIASVILYLVVYMASAYFVSKSDVIKKKKIDLAFVIAILLPVLLAANRYFVGTDFENYYYMYKRMARCPFTQWMRDEMFVGGTPFGIWFVARIAFQFNSYKMFYGLLAFLTFVPAVLMLKKHYSQEIVFFAVFIFLTDLFTTGLNITKQVTAVVFLMSGMQYVHERKFWKFLLILLISWCFHPSALIAFPIYFIWKDQDTAIGFKRLLFIMGCTVFINFLPQVLTAVGGRFETYTIYTDEISNRSFYLNFAWVIYFLIMRRRYVEHDWRNDLYITMVLIGLILNISGFSSPFIKRMAMYYTFPQTILIFQIPFLYTKRENVLFKSLVFIYTIVMFVLNFYVFEFSDIIPYAYGGF